MADIIDRLQAHMHVESAAVAPRTNALIEDMRAAQEEIRRLRSLLREIVENEDVQVFASAIEAVRSVNYILAGHSQRSADLL